MTATRSFARGLRYFLLFAMLFSSLAPVGVQPVQAQEAPALRSPAYGLQTTVENYPPLGVPEFVWDPVGEATEYRLQISPDDGFATIALDVTTANTRFSPLAVSSTLFYDHRWYWRVRVEKPAPGEYSQPYWFDKLWATTENAPGLLAPPPGAKLDFYSLEAFSWTPVMGAARYRIQIAASADGFGAPLYEQVTLATRHQPAAKLANGAYYWRVVPLDPGNNAGQPSAARAFELRYGSLTYFPAEIPQPLEPADGATPAYTPTFKWTAVAGAQFYRLEYTTDPTCDFGAGSTTTVDTRNISYTPTSAFPNDINYCWRVRVHSGASISDWSATRGFVKRWYFRPTPLTPTNGYQAVRFLLLSWTPVPAAARYKVEVSPSNSFPPPYPGWTEYTTNTFYNRPDKALGGTWYWRVTPVDFSNNEGQPSQTFSFNGVHPNSGNYPAPQLAAPLYYYTPDATLQPHEDRSVALPVFQWQRTLVGANQGQVDAYRLQVAEQSDFATVAWQVDSENLSAVPSAGNHFSPAPGGIYYWRVCALDFLGGACLSNPDNGLPLWSDVWKARFDPALGLAPTGGALEATPPNLLRPEPAYEAVEAAPLLEWWPLVEADSYEVQISVAPDFAAEHLVHIAYTAYPAYTPPERLDYAPADPLHNLDYGTYYWRVRGLHQTHGVTGAWSQTWRFQVAAQSHWALERIPGQPANRWLIASAPDDGLDPGYELTALFASQSASNWHFGFPATALDSGRAYGLYIDLDHEDGSGATYDPRGYAITTDAPHRPEYALYIDQTDEPFSLVPGGVQVYRWNGANWDSPQSLLSLGGDLFPTTLYAVAADPTGPATAAGRYGALLDWNGTGWTVQPAPRAATLYGADRQDALGERWVVGAGGTILRWNDAQGVWNVSTNYYTAELHAVEVVTGSLVVAAGEAGTILRWNGLSWIKDSFFDTSFNHNLYSVAMLKPGVSDGWAVGASGKIVHRTTQNYLTKWLEVPSPTTTTLRDVVTLSVDEGWAVGDNGTILQRVGEAWSSFPSPTGEGLRALSFAAPDDGWAVGLNGTILRWDGASWGVYSSPVSSHLYDVELRSASEGWIVGADGTNLHWDGLAWTPVEDPIAGFLEVMVPSTVIGMDSDTGSAAVALFSVEVASGTRVEAVPASVPGELNRFASLSERLQTAAPATNVTGDPATFPSAPPLSWHWPHSASWEGYRLEVSRDPAFTTVDYSELVTALPTEAPYLASALHAPDRDFNGDNTYYWRVRPQYWYPYSPDVNLGGAWSLPARFERNGFAPPTSTLQVSVDFATPSFAWGRVEGAAGYELQVDNDPSFGSPEVRVLTSQAQYTSLHTLPQATYHWRVRALRNNNSTITSDYTAIKGDWVVAEPFTLALPAPTNLQPDDAEEPRPVRAWPVSLCWNPLLVTAGDTPVLAAWKYRLQVSRDANFSAIYDTVDTEQTCWTPVKGYADGLYYWRVSLIDGDSRLGTYSTPAVFQKRYPVVVRLGPPSGAMATATPTFAWGPAYGAAKYRLEISQSPAFSPLYEAAVLTSSARYTPRKSYALDKPYYWRVALVDYDGQQGPYNDVTLPYTQLLHLPLVLR